MDIALKNFEFLGLTDLGKDIILNYDKWYRKFKEKHGCDPFCDKCDKGLKCHHNNNINSLLVGKLTHILNQIYWEQVDLIPDGKSISKEEFIPQVFLPYFTLDEAIKSIIKNWSGAPISGLHRLLFELTSKFTFFNIKKCLVCNRLTGKYHFKVCSLCTEKSCQFNNCIGCQKDYCVNCITIIDKPIPNNYIVGYYGQCTNCLEKRNFLESKFPSFVVDKIMNYY